VASWRFFHLGIGFNGKFDPKGGAPSSGAINHNASIHHFHQLLGDRQPDSGALDIRSFKPKARERLEQLVLFLLRDTGAGVGDGNAELSRRRPVPAGV